MDWIRQQIDRVKLWLLTFYFNRQKKALQKLIENPPQINTQITESCYHQNLKKLGLDTMWYQCKQCKIMFYIFGAASYKKEMFEKESKTVLEEAK